MQSKIVRGFLFLVFPFLAPCASDIKGSKGDPGQDAALSPLLRIHRPGYHWLSNTTIAVDATSANPIVFKFGSELVTSSTTLICDISHDGGIGYRRSGVTLDADTVYYLYGVRSNGVVGLLADSNDPSTGPTGFTDWTYIGAFCTRALDKPLPEFVSNQGRFIANWYWGDTYSGITDWKSITVKAPPYAKFSIGFLETGGNSLDSYGAVSPVSSPSELAFYLYEANTTHSTQRSCEVPFVTPNTLWIKVYLTGNGVGWYSQGWVEDPMEFQ